MTRDGVLKLSAHNLWRSAFVTVLFFVTMTPCAWGLCEGEYENARSLVWQIENEWPLRDRRDSVTLYLLSLFDDVVRSSTRGGAVIWRPRVVRDYSANAYSVGAGYIYVTEGAIRLCDTESELAAILAHEMGHEIAGHFCSAEPPRRGRIYYPFGFRRSADEPRRRVAADKGSLTLDLDPEKEREADRLAVDILRATRFDAHAILEIARRLPMSGSHTPDLRRVETLRRMLEDVPKKHPMDSEQFIRVKQDLSGQRQPYEEP